MNTQAQRFIEYLRLKQRLKVHFGAIDFESQREREADERGMVFEASGPTTQALDDELLDLACDTAEFLDEWPAPEVWVPWDRKDAK